MIFVRNRPFRSSRGKIGCGRVRPPSGEDFVLRQRSDFRPAASHFLDRLLAQVHGTEWARAETLPVFRGTSHDGQSTNGMARETSDRSATVSREIAGRAVGAGHTTISTKIRAAANRAG